LGILDAMGRHSCSFEIVLKSITEVDFGVGATWLEKALVVVAD